MSDPAKRDEKDADWCLPWAVLIALVVFGLLGFFKVFTPKPGITAADVPTAAPPTRTSPTSTNSARAIANAPPLKP